MPTVLECARAARAQGLSVIAVGSDKRPLGRWAQYQTRIPTLNEVETSFNGNVGMAILGGKVSGGFEALDFDVPGFYEDWRDLLSGNGHDDLLERLVVVRTPSGGYHVYFQSEFCERNQKLAQVYGDGKPEVAIETRAEGGYVVTFPSANYTMVQGRISVLPALTEEERFALLHAARLLNVVVEETAQPTPARATDGKRPGDDYNQRTEWSELLDPDGRYWRNFGPVAHWTRHGKKAGTSFTTGLGTNDLGYCWSSNWNARIPADWHGSKFALYTLLNHGGNLPEHFAAAASQLRKEGYGDPLPEKGKAEHGAAVTLVPDAGNGETGPVGERVRRFSRVHWDDLKARPPKPMLVEGFIGQGDSIALVGKRKGGKSAVTFDLILRMLAGNEFANRFEIPRPLRVGYFTEEGTGSVHTRIEAANRDFGLPDAILREAFWYFEELPQLFEDGDEQHIDRLVEELIEDDARLDVIFLDTFVKSIHGAKENDSSDVSRCLKTLGRARKRLGCASVLIHHAGKNGDVRGSSAIDGDVDGLYWVDWDEESGERKMRHGVAKDLMPFDDVHLSLRTVDQGVPGSFAVEWAPATRKPTAKERIVRAMRREKGESWTMAQIRQATGLNTDTTQKTLGRMVEDGAMEQIKPEGTGQITYRLIEKGGEKP